MGGLIEVLLAFMDKGGDVLWLIAALLFVMWTLIFERIWYLQFGWKKDVAQVIAKWEGRKERKSWEARQIRSMLLSQARMQINQYLPVIKTLVALCPLLGLLGTVWGMVNAFAQISALGDKVTPADFAGGIWTGLLTTVAGLLVAIPAVTATEELTYSKESPGLGCWNQNRVTLNRNAFDDVAGDFAVASAIEAGGSGVGVAGEGLHICEWDPLMQQIGNRADSERMGREGGW